MELVDEKLLITFIDACPPPLPGGDYQISVAQDVTWKDNTTPVKFSSAYDFSIFGPRFTIDPAEIQSVFPPPNHLGHFQKYLPHLVFARRSLPWERTITGQIPTKPYYPWLWLLTMPEDEASQAPLQTVKVAEVFNSGNPKIKTPKISPQTGDDPQSQCMVIDMPVTLLEQIAPSLADLEFMASARKVSVENKELTPKTEDEYFSVVLANRFPKNSAKNIQYLVSLEGYADILHPAKIGGGFDKVRFVVLTTWSFTNTDDNQTFDELMKGLSFGRLALSNSSPNADVTKALEMGYSAHDHITRQGEHTVSWYRGPLLPMDMPKDTPDSYPNSDAAIRYDPKFGLFDVSYAAAMQIGRLLALQDQHFTGELTRARSSNQERMLTLLQRHALLSRMNGLLAIPRDAHALLNRDVFVEAVARHWAEALAPRILSAKLSEAPLFGEPGDPSGLRKHAATFEGLLTEEQIQALIDGNETDVAEAIRRMLFE
jgi:hypothetical protein